MVEYLRVLRRVGFFCLFNIELNKKFLLKLLSTVFTTALAFKLLASSVAAQGEPAEKEIAKLRLELDATQKDLGVTGIPRQCRGATRLG